MIEEQIKRKLNPEELIEILGLDIDYMCDILSYEILEAAAQGKFYFLTDARSSALDESNGDDAD